MSAPVPDRPPRLARWLLERLLRGPEGEALLGDLLESWSTAPPARRRGAARALRFWREALSALHAAGPHRAPARRPTPSRGDPLVPSFLGELRLAARLLRRAPAFVLLCVATLALGTGTAAAIFGVVNPLLLRPLPYEAPDRLLVVHERDEDGGRVNTSFATFADLVAAARGVERAAAVGGWEPTVSGSDGHDAERLVGQRVSWTYFDVLGVRPAVGRPFRADEDVPGAPRVVMLGHGLWARRFGGDTSLVGRTIDLDGTPHLVAGVLPPDFDNVLNPHAQIWRVLGYGSEQPWACRTCRHLRMIARVDSGAAIATAAAELDAIARRLYAEHPRDYPVAGVQAVPLQAEVTRAVRPVLLAIGAAATLVLLLAVVTTANLQLARAMRRETEFAIRSALGASRGRLARLLLAEGVLLTTLATAAAVALAHVGLRLLLAQLPDRLPRLAAVRVDSATVALALGLTLLLALGTGLLPALLDAGRQRFGALRSGSRATAARRRARAALVAGEVALALVLLVGAGLLGRSLTRLLAVSPGFDPAGLLTMGVQATGPAYADSGAVFANHDRLRAAVGALPGVAAVGLANQLPLSGHTDMNGIRARDRPLENPSLAPDADRYAVSPDFLAAMRIPVLRGRPLTSADDSPSAPPVAVVSAGLAAALWPGEDPLGRQLQLGAPDSPWRTVVGVVGDVRHHGLDAERPRQIYLPERQWGEQSQMVLVVRTAGDPTAVVRVVRDAVRSVDAAQPITRVATMEELIATSTANRRFALLLFGLFGTVAMVLAGAGIYGVLAGRVAERTREIGVRSALGAEPRAILRIVVAEGLRLTLLGVAAGTAAALALSRFLESLLYGVRPADPVALAGAAALLGVVALAASLVPALRALRIGPAAALRAE